MKRYLLTGAAGFIGSHLGNRLTAIDYEVTGFDSLVNACGQPLKFRNIRGDIRKANQINDAARDVDAIVHLAALINVDESNIDPRPFYDTNVLGTMNVLEAARRLDKDVVFASSSEVYGASDVPIGEGHAFDNRSPYAASKTAADRMCAAWQYTYGLKVNIVRTFNVYGPWQSSGPYGGVIAKFARQAINGLPMTIYGDGRQRRDYLWVDDAVSAYLLALRRRFDGPVNFGTGDTVSIREIAKHIGRRLKAQWVYEDARPGEVRELVCDWSKARCMGWRPRVDFRTGLGRYLDWAVEYL